MDRRAKTLKYLERYGPYIGGFSAFLIGFYAQSKIFTLFSATGMNQKESVGAVFDVMVTLTAFLFSVFILAIAPGGGFIERIFNTKSFIIFRRYVVEALLLGSLSALSSVPFMSTDAGRGVWSFVLPQIVWGAIAITAALAFLRVVHIFILWLGYDQVQRRARRA